MELYCGGNQVEGVREVGHLRGLPKLIILDLTGNPMAAHDDYRLYTIYHLRKLKVQPCRPVVSAGPACRILPGPRGGKMRIQPQSCTHMCFCSWYSVMLAVKAQWASK